MNNPPWIANRTNATGWQEASIGMMATQPSFHLPAISQAPPMGMQQSRTASGDPGQNKQRVFTGAITKVSDTFGFVDEDVFFQTTVCKGGNPKVGDKVLVEASYNANMPFKWNATRIQIIPNMPGITSSSVTHTPKPAYQPYSSPMHQSAAAPKYAQHSQGPPQQRSSMGSVQVKPSYQASSYSYKPVIQSNNSGPSSSSRASRFDQRGGSGSTPSSQPTRSSQSRRSPHRDSRSSKRYSPTPSTTSIGSRKRSRSPRLRSRSPVSSRGSISTRRSRSPRTSRARSRTRSRSPKHRRRTSPVRPALKYSVHSAPHSLDVSDCSVMELKSRYASLYIPSDFSKITYNWVDSFPLNSQFELKPVNYHVLDKEVLPDTLMIEGEKNAEFEPADFNYEYSAKVMLLATPAMEQLYRLCCNLAESGSRNSENREHPAKVIQFLVGYKQGKPAEPIAIGGPWSPSLDGPDPATNPQTLINTAIRTARSLTGIDLSKCTRWYRFLELDYIRTDVKKTGYTREKVVIFLPDVWTCVPTILDYRSLQERLNSKLEDRFQPPPREPTPEPEKPAAVQKESTDDTPAEEKTDASLKQGEEMDTSTKEPTESQSAESQTNSSVAEDSALDDSTAGMDVDKEGLPTHWSKLDVKTMKVADLKAELEARDEVTKGLKKPQLVTKLTKVLKQEQAGEEEKKQTESAESKDGENSAESKDGEKSVESKDGEKSAESKDGEKSAESKDGEKSAESKDGDKSAEVGEVKKEEDRKDEKMETEEQKDEVKTDVKKEEKADIIEVIEIKDEGSETVLTEETTTSDKPAAKKEPTLTPEQVEEKKRVEKSYNIPSDSCIVVLPDREARGGKFDCSLMSLNVLLDYRHDDNKEHMFEVSLFAEAFNEMLMRDFGFQIYTKLTETYETRIRDEKRKKEREERERKEKEERERKEKEERERKEKEEKERKEREEKERKEREEKERIEREEKERKEKEERELKEKEERERKEKEEKERKEREEKERLEKEKLEKERLEKERLEKEKKEQEEKERLEKEEAEKKTAEEKSEEKEGESEAKTETDKPDEKMETDAEASKDEDQAAEQKKKEQEQLKQKEAEELKKKKEAEEAELKKKKEAEEAELKKKKEAEEAELKKKKEAEEAELKKKKEAEEAELKKKKEAEEAKLKKKRDAEAAELKKKHEAEEAELKRKYEAEEAALKKKKQAELKKKKEAEEAELKKKKEAEEEERKKKEEESKRALESPSKTSVDKKRPRDKSEDRDSKKSKTDSKRSQPVTVDKKSLLAFTYYDSNRCGYILDKDLEDILYTLGLRLSRSQVSRLIKKCITGDAVHYKRLTDVNEDKIEEYMEDKINIDPNTLVEGLVETAASGSAPASKDSSIVMYKGSYIDLDSVLNRLQEADQIKSDLEAEMKNITTDRDGLRNTVSSLEDGTSRLQQKLKSTREELDITVRNRDTIQTEAEDYKRVLTSSSQELSKVLRRVNSLILPVDKSENKE